MCNNSHWRYRDGQPSSDRRDHCHYEQRQRDTRGRGPLRRTSTSSIINCHQHHSCNPKHCLSTVHFSTRQCSCHQNGGHSRPSPHEDIVASLIDQLKTQQRCSKHANPIEYDRSTLDRLLDELLRQPRRSYDSSSTCKDSMIDLLLRLISESSSECPIDPITSTQHLDDPPPYTPHHARSRPFDFERNETSFPVPRPTYSDWSSPFYPVQTAFVPRAVHTQTRYIFDGPDLWFVDCMPPLRPSWNPMRPF